MKMLKVTMQSTEGEMDLFNITLCSLSVNDPGKRTFAGNPIFVVEESIRHPYFPQNLGCRAYSALSHVFY